MLKTIKAKQSLWRVCSRPQAHRLGKDSSRSLQGLVKKYRGGGGGGGGGGEGGGGGGGGGGGIGVRRSRKGVGHEVLSLVQGVGRAMFSYPLGVGHLIL